MSRRRLALVDVDQNRPAYIAPGFEIEDTTGQIYVNGSLINTGGGTPGGGDTQVQFNNGGAFDGLPFYYTKTAPPGAQAYAIGLPNDSSLDPNIQDWNKPTPFNWFFNLDDEAPNSHVVNGALGLSVQGNAPGRFTWGLQIISFAHGDTANSGALESEAAVNPQLGETQEANAIVADALSFGDGTSTLRGILLRQNSFSGTVAASYGIDIMNQSHAGTPAGEAAAIRIRNQSNTGAYGIKVEGGQNDLGPQQTKVGQLLVTAPSVPASATSTGVAGTIAWDSGFVYVCIATDTWRRAALSSW